ncbi:MAG: hypothetical protein ACYDD1_19900 [Caulobacteraceae bacterium]
MRINRAQPRHSRWVIQPNEVLEDGAMASLLSLIGAIAATGIPLAALFASLFARLAAG